MTTEDLMKLLGDFPEINPSNYGDDDVNALNAWGIAAHTALEAQGREVAEYKQLATRAIDDAVALRAELAAIRAQLNQQTDMVEKCMVAMNENADRGQKAEAALSATADWLWGQFMDWCKKRKVAPANYDDLFEIVHKVRSAAPVASPDVGALTDDACEVLSTVMHFIPASEPKLAKDVSELCHTLRSSSLTQSQAARVSDASPTDRDAGLVADGWQPIETAPNQQIVLIHYQNSLGNGRTVKARFTPRYTEEASGDSDEGVEEYDPKNDRCTLVEGWWEQIDNWGDFSEVYIAEHKPTHWMPLPVSPKIGGV